MSGQKKLGDLVYYNVELIVRNGRLTLKLTNPDEPKTTIFLNDGDTVIVDGKTATVDIMGATQATLVGSVGHDILVGNNLNNTISGNNGADSIFGFGGNDVIFGQGGEDYILAGAGNDYVYGGNGNDFLQGDDGDDVLSGENGDDAIDGGRGNDTIYGGSGNNIIDGNDGNDIIFVGSSDGVVLGGRGIDTVNFSLFASAFASDPRYGSTGIYIVPQQDGSADYRSIALNGGDIKVVSGSISGIERIVGSALDDNIFAWSGIDYIHSNDGNDIISLNAKDVTSKGMTMVGGNGDDIYDIAFGPNAALSEVLQINYTQGRDRIVLADVDEIQVNRTEPQKNDLMISVRVGTQISVINVVNGWSAYTNGDLNIVRQNYKLFGIDNSLVGDPPKAYLEKLSPFAETLKGGRGADLIANGTGSYDWYAKNPLASMYQSSLCTMTGGAGADNFLLWSGGTITDFNYKADTLIFAAEIFGGMKQIKDMKRKEFGNTLVIDTGFKNPVSAGPTVNQPITLTLQGVSNSDFTAALNSGHVRVQALAGVSAASFGL